MTREEKKAKRKAQALSHRNKRNEKYFSKIREVRNLGYNVPLSASTKYGTGCWRDPNSPTGYSQVCDYQPSFHGTSICQYPCNGDC